MLNDETIKKYNNRSLKWLKKKASERFHKFIRLRDVEKGCISCGAKVEQAGHFYSAGHYPGLRFNEDNVHGQCVRCNYYLSGNLNEYRKHLLDRIGAEKLKGLDIAAGIYKKQGYKWSRFYLIEIIEKYKV